MATPSSISPSTEDDGCLIAPCDGVAPPRPDYARRAYSGISWPTWIVLIAVSVGLWFAIISVAVALVPMMTGQAITAAGVGTNSQGGIQ